MRWIGWPDATVCTSRPAVTARVEEASALMSALRKAPPAVLAGVDVEVADLALRRGQDRTDALIFTGSADGVALRVAVRPSGTEPKVKGYIEIRVAPTEELATARACAIEVQQRVEAELLHLFSQRGPN